MTVLISDEIDFMRQQLISSEGNVPNDKKSIQQEALEVIVNVYRLFI